MCQDGFDNGQISSGYECYGADCPVEKETVDYSKRRTIDFKITQLCKLAIYFNYLDEGVSTAGGLGGLKDFDRCRRGLNANEICYDHGCEDASCLHTHTYS